MTVNAFKFIQEDVLPGLSHVSRPCLFLIAGFLASGSLGHADDAKPVARPGYRLVPVKQGDKTAYIQVKDSSNPFKNVKDSSSSNKSTQFSFNQASPFANKTYASSETVVSPDGTSYQRNLERTFLTKSYFPEGKGDKSEWQTKFATSSANDLGHKASGYDKNFGTSRADAGQDKTAAFASLSSDLQGRTATLGGHDVKTYASSLSDKTYHGRETDLVKNDLDRMNQGMESMKDLPDRPLTIDEVRALINHGVKPDLKQSAPDPTEASKPLNDPTYEPDAPPAPLHDTGPRTFRDDDGVPSPGTMAAPSVAPPENSEPLPK